MGDRLGEANTRQSLGSLALASGDPQKAFEEYRAALDIHLQVQDRVGIGADYGYMARAAAAAKAYTQAVILADQSLDIFREIGDRWGQALSLQIQAESLWQAGAQMPAMAAWWQARSLLQSIGAPAGQIDAIFSQLRAADEKQWAEIEKSLAANAEGIRQEGVLAAQKSLSDQADEDKNDKEDH